MTEVDGKNRERKHKQQLRGWMRATWTTHNSLFEPSTNICIYNLPIPWRYMQGCWSRSVGGWKVWFFADSPDGRVSLSPLPAVSRHPPMLQEKTGSTIPPLLLKITFRAIWLSSLRFFPSFRQFSVITINLSCRPIEGAWSVGVINKKNKKDNEKNNE